MEGVFLTSSFRPPAVTRASAHYAPWVLLDTKAYFAVRENATSAEALTSTGRAIKVTFCLADPPAISHFCVHGPAFQPGDFASVPQVVFSAKDLVLLRFAFTVGPWRTRRYWPHAEYFVYKADRGKPSLTLIPYNPPGTVNSSQICVLPFDDDGGFLLADLFMTKLRCDYELHVFSSKTCQWTITPLRLQTSPWIRKEDLPGPHLDKVISLGGGAVGWVDLWRGIVTCNVFHKNPFLSFIPVPTFGCDERREGDARLVRDITCCNGFIKFVGLDVHFKDIVIPKRRGPLGDLDNIDIIYDSELLFHDDDDDDDDDDVFTTNPVERTAACDCWKLRTWYRLTSLDYWCKGQIVDVDDILADNPSHSMLLPQLSDAQAGRSTLRKLYLAYPTLGIDGDDVVYVMSKVTYHGRNAWMLGVDIGKKMVEVLVPVSSERVGYFDLNLLVCEFSKYLNAAQG